MEVGEECKEMKRGMQAGKGVRGQTGEICMHGMEVGCYIL